MRVIRGLYLYVIAFIALGMFLMGAVQLSQQLLQNLIQTLGGDTTAVGESLVRQRLSFSIALAVIGLLGWTIHWGLAMRPLSGPDAFAERGSTIRRLYLYLVLFSGGLIGISAASGLAHDLLRALFGELTRSAIISGAIVDPAALLAIAGALWAYHARVAAVDRTAQPEVAASATLRRWFIYGLSFYSLVLLLAGLVGLLQSLWSQGLSVLPGAPTVAADSGLFAAEVAASGGAALAALVVWLAAARWSYGWLVRSEESDPERSSLLRKVYFYLVLAIAVSFTTWSAGNALYQVLRVLLVAERAALGAMEVARGLGPALAAMLVFGMAWAYHARSLRHEAAALTAEAPRQAIIRWLYSYLVAVVGLAAVAVGIAGTMATLLDLAIQPSAARPTAWWQDHISLFATLAVVGLPVWLPFWLPLQREAADAVARRSVVRRVYLFLLFGATVLTLLIGGVFALYQVVRLALGEAWTSGQTTDTLSAISALVVAALLLVYHLRILRIESGAPAQPEAAVYAISIVARSVDAAQLEAYQRELLAHAPVGVELRVEPASFADARAPEAKSDRVGTASRVEDPHARAA